MCVADVSDFRDLETIRSRVEEEGLSFLTITLPSFAKDFERSLEQGFIDSNQFREFRKWRRIPAFLRGILSLIFDSETGRILNYETCSLHPTPISTLVDCTRQICLAFKKMEFVCTPKRVQKALDDFVQCEQSFEMFSLQGEEQESFLRVSSLLWDNIMARIELSNIVPRHGPGATAEGVSGNRKFQWQYWHERLNSYFPFIGYAYPNLDMYAYPEGVDKDSPRLEELELVQFLDEDQEIPVKVTPVPKTLKAPRIIAIEPCCMQYAQQGIRKALYSAIESSRLTRGHVNFRDQEINQDLAISSSKTGLLATVDLSEASDRVPHDLAIRMFDGNPDLRDAIDACRSTKAKLPDGTIIGPLKKFASMGSALCFPVEAMYFYTLCVKALLELQNLPVTRRNAFRVSREVYVYGDDLVIPSRYATTILDHLQKYNCKVNTSKSFWIGKFRESCGVDAYDGDEVTPIYCRKPFPRNRQQAAELISHVSTANSFYKKGMWRTSSFLFQKVERILGPLPYVSGDSACLGRYSYLGFRSIERWNRNLHSLEVRGWIPRPVYRTDILDGYGAFQKCLSMLEVLSEEPLNRDEHHLERSALHHAVALKRGWVPTS